MTSQFGARLVNVFAFGKEKGASYPSDEELRKQLLERRLQEIRESAATRKDRGAGTAAAEPVKAEPEAPGPAGRPAAP